ncbi:MAG TPA: DNA-3-methyladenine glycosylase I [Candidatus Deferrimicrobiaceae bacterium]
MIRCPWAGEDPGMVRYHDEEWGTPQRDDRALFEFLILEGAQAGLSWSTILRKREAYRRAFLGFDPEKIARYADADMLRLLADPGIVRNRLKVKGAVRNARATLSLVEERGSLSDFLWEFVGGEPVVNAWRSMSEVPAQTDASRAMSRELLRRNFTFVGPTICYAFMQATGMVNDHLVDCFRHPPSR